MYIYNRTVVCAASETTVPREKRTNKSAIPCKIEKMKRKKKKILKRTPSRHQKKKNTTPKKRETIEVWIVFVQFFFRSVFYRCTKHDKFSQI